MELPSYGRLRSLRRCLGLVVADVDAKNKIALVGRGTEPISLCEVSGVAACGNAQRFMAVSSPARAGYGQSAYIDHELIISRNTRKPMTRLPVVITLRLDEATLASIRDRVGDGSRVRSLSQFIREGIRLRLEQPHDYGLAGRRARGAGARHPGGAVFGVGIAATD